MLFFCNISHSESKTLDLSILVDFNCTYHTKICENITFPTAALIFSHALCIGKKECLIKKIAQGC